MAGSAGVRLVRWARLHIGQRRVGGGLHRRAGAWRVGKPCTPCPPADRRLLNAVIRQRQHDFAISPQRFRVHKPCFAQRGLRGEVELPVEATCPAGQAGSPLAASANSPAPPPTTAAKIRCTIATIARSDGAEMRSTAYQSRPLSIINDSAANCQSMAGRWLNRAIDPAAQVAGAGRGLSPAAFTAR
jgi:hypothetical protein